MFTSSAKYLLIVLLALGLGGSIAFAAYKLVNKDDNKTTQSTNDTNQSDQSSKCIITVSGKKYDVTTLKNTHSGGDIFNCGTDMTNDFNEEHGSRYKMIEKYLVN